MYGPYIVYSTMKETHDCACAAEDARIKNACFWLRVFVVRCSSGRLI